MKDVWIDPPMGWRYGFPKICPADRLGDLTAWLIEQGYPPEYANQKTWPIRCWHTDPDAPQKTQTK